MAVCWTLSPRVAGSLLEKLHAERAEIVVTAVEREVSALGGGAGEGEACCEPSTRVQSASRAIELDILA